MQDEILAKALESDSEVIPRYNIKDENGNIIIENGTMELVNEVLTAGTPYDVENCLSPATAAALGGVENVDEGLMALAELPMVGYGVCSTAAGTAAKEVAVTGFALKIGASVTVQFAYGNTAASPTLNVAGTGAKSLYRGDSVYTDLSVPVGGVLTMVYDGTGYQTQLISASYSGTDMPADTLGKNGDTYAKLM